MEMEETKTASELLAEAEREAYERLKDPDLSEADRPKALAEAKALTELRLKEEEQADTRRNNAVRNDIEQAKIVVEHGKLQNDKARTRSNWIIACLGFGFGFLGNGASYFLDPLMQPNKRFARFGEKASEFFLRLVK